jgi:preprotein translocase subunit SecA
MSFMESLNRLLGDPNAREIKKLWPLVREVRTAGERPEINALTLETLPAKTQSFKDRVAKGEKLDDILPEAFATAIRACELLKESGQKIQMGKQEFGWDMIPFDVQIMGGIVLHRGCISEMKTGEGKTLVCTLPVYLNALEGKGVHVVTVNDYLARRDATWMGMLYKALGLSVGVIVHGLPNDERKAAYDADVTYGTNSEFGFDYLRDNMATAVSRQVQRGLHYAIVDEVDSILIDEARTPLIISQPAEESTTKYKQYAQLVGGLVENVDFNKDEKQRAATLTEEGIKKMEKMLGVENIYTERGFEEVHHIEQALRAHAIYKRDVDYIVKDGEVIIVDEFTGRLMPGRRYSYGLHQAIEAKENVEVQRESKTLATITFQNYFRIFKKLAGMTGTAKTEEEEFESIYKLRTIVVPTHRPMVRADKSDLVFKNVAAKFKAAAKLAKEKFDRGQPVLIGTTSVEKSEAMHLLLEQLSVPHQVLNAKHHEKEAEIVAKAGQKGAITIATNMAGRGTDIKLGEGVKELGGLVILGTERHEARRIDNQLRGRAGRQGDPGESQFFVSMEDDLMRLFGGERLKSMMDRLNVPDDVPLESSMVSRSIESAQKKVEGRNFDIRRHVLQYDDVMNKHRDIIYKRRQKLLEKMSQEDQASAASDQDELPLHKEILQDMQKEVEAILAAHASSDDYEEWNVKEIVESITALHGDFAKVVTEESVRSYKDKEKLWESLVALVTEAYQRKCDQYDAETVRNAENLLTLRSIDTHWMDHIDDMSHLREQVAFAGYAQRDPLIEYQDQGFRRFQQLIATISATITRMLLQLDFTQFSSQAMTMMQRQMEEAERLQTNADQIEGGLNETGVNAGAFVPTESHALPEQQFAPLANAPSSPRVTVSGNPSGQPQRIKAESVNERHVQKVGRNDPCPCGSGKKYKKCHGKDE